MSASGIAASLLPSEDLLSKVVLLDFATFYCRLELHSVSSDTLEILLDDFLFSFRLLSLLGLVQALLAHNHFSLPDQNKGSRLSHLRE